MRYGIFINQIMCLEWGITGRQSNAAHVFAILHEAHAWAEEIIIDGQVYYWTSRNAICDELAYLELKPDTVYRHLKFLHEKGLISYTKQGKKDCIRITDEGKKWNAKNSEANPKKAKTRKQIRENPDLNPKKLGSKSEKNPDLNPTYQSTSIDQKTNDQKTTHSVRAIEKNISFESEKSILTDSPKNNFSPPPPDDSPHLRKWLDDPLTPDFIELHLRTILEWARKHEIFIDWWTPRGFENNRHAVNSMLHKLAVATNESPTSARFADHLESYLRRPMDHDYWRSGISLTTLNTGFEKIFNLHKPKKNVSNTKPTDYSDLAKRQHSGEKINF